MSIMHAVAARLARTSYGRKAVESRADLSIFKEQPSARLVTGLVLMAISFTIGWPGVGAAGIAALVLKKPLIFIVGAPVVYGVSHMIWAVSMYLIGRDNIMYMNTVTKYCARIFIEKYGTSPEGLQGTKASAEGTTGSPSKRSIDSEYPPTP